jgi:ribosome-binding protein aMBF1 (putative translation factor)
MKAERTTERRVIRCPQCGLVQFWPDGKQKCVKSGCNHVVAWNRIPSGVKMTARMELHPEAPIGTDAERVEMHKIRLERGMSPNELAKRMGCPRTYISKIERKKVTPV